VLVRFGWRGFGFAELAVAGADLASPSSQLLAPICNRCLILCSVVIGALYSARL